MLNIAFVCIFFIINQVLYAKDGDILNIQKYVPDSYNQFDKRVSIQLYNYQIKLFNDIHDAEFFKITYESDKLHVKAILGKPKKLANQKKYPLVIYNRGGFKDSGKVDVITILYELHYLISNGYIVLASQYRGNDGSDGVYECGGSDINDVLNLIKTAKNLDYIDTNNIFMLGFSRGGMMTYLSLKNNCPLNAVAIIAGISDLNMFAKMRPDAEQTILKEAINLKNKEQEYANRSAIGWTNLIQKPVLLIHNQFDSIVAVQQSQVMANALKALNKPHQLIIYNDIQHSLNKYRDQAHREILNWFKKYLR